jgi:type IV pilus assembly protein PilA
MVLVVGSLLASVWAPNFNRIRGRSRQAEVKTNLRAIYAGQQALYATSNAYATNLRSIGFAPARGNRYHYDLGTNYQRIVTGLPFGCDSWRNRHGAVEGPGTCGVGGDTFRHGAGVYPTSTTHVGSVTWTPRVSRVWRAPYLANAVGVNAAACPSCDFAAKAVANIDEEPDGDIWYVGSQLGSVVPTACADQYLAAPPGTPINSRDDVVCDP